MLGLFRGGGATFSHGIHPAEHKGSTEGLAIQRMPFGERFVLPLNQHIGAPCRPVVSVGETVQRGQPIALPAGFVSTSLHSPVTGKVVAIAPRRHPSGKLMPAIEIAIDPYSDQVLAAEAPTDLTDLPGLVQAAGIVGLGGAAFPSHVKYKMPPDRTCKILVLNGCECEPYLTCDHRIMVERPDAVIRGAQIVAGHLQAERIAIGVELNKPDAISSLILAADGAPIRVDVVPLTVKYPQGAEQMLIQAIYGRQVPAGKLPLDLEMVVNNVGTMAAVADLVDGGLPLVERVVTVSGPGVRRPGNLTVPLGTSLREVLEFCGGLREETIEVVMGGPMMGTPIADLDAPVLKGTSGILAFTAGETGRLDELPCVRCGRCLEACAKFLNPSLLARLVRVNALDDLGEAWIWDCMECGACTYTCPSGIPIAQMIRAGKAALRRRGDRP